VGFFEKAGRRAEKLKQSATDALDGDDDCPACGESVPAEATACPNCGADLDAEGER